MKPDLRDPRLLRAWALTFVERGQSEAVSGVVRIHFDRGNIIRCETTRQETPAGLGDDCPDSHVNRKLLAWVEQILEREQRDFLFGVVNVHLDSGWLVRSKVERNEKPPRLAMEACAAVG